MHGPVLGQFELPFWESWVLRLLVAGSLHRYWNDSPGSNWGNLFIGSRLQSSSWVRSSFPWFFVCQGWLWERRVLVGGQSLGSGVLREQCNQNKHLDLCCAEGGNFLMRESETWCMWGPCTFSLPLLCPSPLGSPLRVLLGGLAVIVT